MGWLAVWEKSTHHQWHSTAYEGYKASEAGMGSAQCERKGDVWLDEHIQGQEGSRARTFWNSGRGQPSREIQLIVKRGP